ncbi:MAG: GreA/GreB family elongation factor [Bryobacterales bacterium]
MRYANDAGTEREVSIVGADEVDLSRNHISWVSPLARAPMKAEEVMKSFERRAVR